MGERIPTVTARAVVRPGRPRPRAVTGSSVRPEPIRDAALAVLLFRHGGLARYSEAELAEIAGYFGGPDRLNVRVRVYERPGQPRIVELALEERGS